MFQEIMDKLKRKKQQLQSLSVNTPPSEEKEIHEIVVSKENSFFKIEIPDYIPIMDYLEYMKSANLLDIVGLVSNSVLWNGERQKVNKGIYYILTKNNRIYNIFISDNFLKIDERTQREGITEEKIIRM